MTVTTVAAQNGPVLSLRVAFPEQRETQPTPLEVNLTAGDLLLSPVPRAAAPQYFTLRRAQQEQPAGGRNTALIEGGPRTYVVPSKLAGRPSQWWRRFATGQRTAYVAWAKMNRGAYTSIYPLRPVRARTAYGAIYSRWPVFGEAGRILSYAWMCTLVDFRILDSDPHQGDALRLNLTHVTGSLGPKEGKGHDLHFGEALGSHWTQLATTAKNAFNQQRGDQLDPAMEQWRVWFLGELDKAKADRCLRDGFHAMMTPNGGPGWMAALDSVEEAWQLAAVLEGYGYLFPQGVMDSQSPMDWKSFDGMERRLLDAYLALRPQRRAELEQMMAEYVLWSAA